MDTLTTVMVVLQIISAIGLLILVLMQRLKESDGITVQNNQDNGSSGMGVSRDKRLSRYTVFFAVAFFIFTFATATLLVSTK